LRFVALKRTRCRLYPRTAMAPHDAPQSLAQAVRSERAASARRINPLRLFTVLFFWSLFLLLGVVLGQPAWRANLSLFSAYLLASAVTYFLSRRNDALAELSGYALAFFDIPVVYLLQRSTFEASTSAGAVAGFTIALFALIIAASVLSLDARQIAATALSGTVFGIALQTEAGITLGGRISTPVVLGLTALAGYFLYRRLLELTRRLLEDEQRRREIEQHLEHADRMAMLGMLQASVAHEVGNPLTYLLGNLDLLRMKAASYPDLQRSIEDAHKGAERIAAILNDMRAMARKDAAEATDIDVRKVLEGTLDLARAAIRKRAQLEVQLNDVPSVAASEVRLSQVFLNLLINAAQAIPDEPGHTVTVRSTTGPAGEAVVTVSDTGVGIRPEDRPRLFEPFFTTKAKGEGTGLGLSISAELVRAYGGAIEVDSELGRGSTFRVRLPKSGAPALVTGP
jgi:signal transduction histidine kinase